MINNIKINNFQSHKDTELDFHTGMNVIIGQSDSGKTAILRALDLVIINKPSGSAFVSDGEDTTVVAVTLDSGLVIRREKGNKINSYFTELEDGTEVLEFKAFKADPPEEIAGLLNIDSINIQRQHDAPFLLSKSPGEVARYLNQIAGIDKIDSATQYATRKVNEFTKEHTRLKNDLAALHSELAGFNFIPDFEAGLVALEHQESKIKEIDDNRSNITFALRKINEYSKALEKLNRLNSTELERCIGEMEEQLEKQSIIEDKADKLMLRIQSAKSYTKALKKAQDFPAEKLQNTIDVLEATIRNQAASKKNIDSLSVLISTSTTYTKRITALSKQLSTAEKELAAIDVCPLCEQPWRKK